MAALTGIRTIFFDYDGTLHDTAAIYHSAFCRAYTHLAERGLAEPRDWQVEEVTGWLGIPAAEMWDTFMPGLDAEVKQTCSALIGESMIGAVKAGQARLYPGARKTLQTLRERGYRPVFLSNCRRPYMDAHRTALGLDELFHQFYCSGDFGFAPKHEVLARVAPFHPRGQLVVGDRRQDMEAAERCGLPGVACRYGFGRPEEWMGATSLIGDITELLDLLP